MAGFSFIGSPAFLLLVSEIYDTFANEAEMILANSTCILLWVRNGFFGGRWTWVNETPSFPFVRLQIGEFFDYQG